MYTFLHYVSHARLSAYSFELCSDPNLLYVVLYMRRPHEIEHAFH
jgi:hypothetical protein